jgi:hypothetical protein
MMAILATIIWLGCQRNQDRESSGPPPPLADTLTTLFVDAHEAVRNNDPDRFLALLDPAEKEHLADLTEKYGFSSLRTYLEHHFVNWPDLDTLDYGGLINTGNYARLTLVGNGSSFGRGGEKLCYTFLLFRHGRAGWGLTAMASLEKERFDRFGYEVTYHETELPPKLRFPRQF